jgi:CRP-like cAMP-binding protein
LKRGDRALISGCVLFTGTADAFVARALADERCRLVTLGKGADVAGAYDYRRCLGLVLSGSIAVTKNSSSRFVMNTLGRGSLFGAANLYDEDCAEDDAAAVSVLTAVAPCRIVFFPRGLVETLMGEERAVALNYIRFLTGRVKFLNGKIQGLVSESAEDALKQYLILNAGTDAGKLLVRLPGSISALAEQLNIGRASLYRAFEALEKERLIRKTGKEIEILDVGGLTGTE